MNTLHINLTGLRSNFRPYLVIDGKNIPYKRNATGSYDAVYTTDKDSANILVYKYLEIRGKLWWLMSLLFFFVSVFGIFDSRYDKKCIVAHLEYNVRLQGENHMQLAFYPPHDKLRAADAAGDFPAFEEKQNILGVDVLKMTVPVSPGRNIAVVIEAAASVYRLKMMGYNALDELTERLLNN